MGVGNLIKSIIDPQGGGLVNDATKVDFMEDTDTGVHAINTGTFQSIGLIVTATEVDTLNEDIRVSVEIPSVTGSSGSTKIEFGLFIDGNVVRSAEESIGNAEIPVNISLIRTRGSPQILGNVDIEMKIKDVSGTAIVDNSVGGNGRITVEQYQDKP